MSLEAKQVQDRKTNGKLRFTPSYLTCLNSCVKVKAHATPTRLHQRYLNSSKKHNYQVQPSLEPIPRLSPKHGSVGFIYLLNQGPRLLLSPPTWNWWEKQQQHNVTFIRNTISYPYISSMPFTTRCYIGNRSIGLGARDFQVIIVLKCCSCKRSCKKPRVSWLVFRERGNVTW
jgi:hypothetical protein